MILAGITLLLGVAVGYLRGGRLERLAAVEVRWPWLLGLAVAAQLGLAAAGATGAGGPLALQGLLAGSLALVVAFGWVNRSLPAIWLILLGLALNTAVIVPNGAMPVAPEALTYLGGEAAIEPGKHRLLADGDLLPWLADVIPVPGLRIVVSVGDIVLALGVGALVMRLMLGPRGRHAAPYGSRPPAVR